MRLIFLRNRKKKKTFLPKLVQYLDIIPFVDKSNGDGKDWVIKIRNPNTADYV
jgi:hypothetical protein